MGCIFSYRLSVLKLLVVIEQIILICGEQAYASTEDFTKGFLSTAPHKMCLSGIPGEDWKHWKPLKWWLYGSCKQDDQAAGLVGCSRRMECQCLTNRPWNVIEMKKWDSAVLHRNENCQQWTSNVSQHSLVKTVRETVALLLSFGMGRVGVGGSCWI